MPDVLIRDLDAEVHQALKRRAEQKSLSLQAYITMVLSDHAKRPTVDEWLARLDRLDPVEGPAGADAVAAARSEGA